jgi:hypothetical protein
VHSAVRGAASHCAEGAPRHAARRPLRSGQDTLPRSALGIVARYAWSNSYHSIRAVKADHRDQPPTCQLFPLPQAVPSRQGDSISQDSAWTFCPWPFPATTRGARHSPRLIPTVTFKTAIQVETAAACQCSNVRSVFRDAGPSLPPARATGGRLGSIRRCNGEFVPLAEFDINDSASPPGLGYAPFKFYRDADHGQHPHRPLTPPPPGPRPGRTRRPRRRRPPGPARPLQVPCTGRSGRTAAVTWWGFIGGSGSARYGAPRHWHAAPSLALAGARAGLPGRTVATQHVPPRHPPRLQR